MVIVLWSFRTTTRQPPARSGWASASVAAVAIKKIEENLHVGNLHVGNLHVGNLHVERQRRENQREENLDGDAVNVYIFYSVQ